MTVVLVGLTGGTAGGLAAGLLVYWLTSRRDRKRQALVTDREEQQHGRPHQGEHEE